MRIGVDVGGTNVALGSVVGGHIVGRAKVATPAEGGLAALLDAITTGVDELRVDPAAPGHLAGVGVGVPGQVDPVSQDLLTAANLDLAPPVALREELHRRVGAPVDIDNDVNVAALGEFHGGSARGVGDVLAVTVGTGIGGALILDGALRQGPHGRTGEIGHMVYRPDGRVCGCGGAGHLEAYAGRAGMEREARRRMEAGTASALGELAGDGPMKSKVWMKALKAGDELAVELIDEAVRALGAVVGSVVSLVDLSTVIVGGGLAGRLGGEFVDRIGDGVNATAFGSGAVAVKPFALGDDAALLGAASLGADAGATR